MSAMSYDALIIGGGPGGSTAATLLARAQRRVAEAGYRLGETLGRMKLGEPAIPPKGS